MSVIHFQQYFDDFNHFLQKIDIFQKMVILADFGENGHIGTFCEKIDEKMQKFINRLWNLKKWFEKVLSHYYHLFLPYLRRKIDIDEKKVDFSLFLPFFLTIHFKMRVKYGSTIFSTLLQNKSIAISQYIGVS